MILKRVCPFPSMLLNSITMNKIILGFDGWTKGCRNYERLVIPLKKAGYDLKL